MKGTFAEKMGESNQIPSSSLLPNRTDVDSDETNTEFAYIMQARHACQHGFVDQVKQLLDSGLVLPNSIDQVFILILHKIFYARCTHRQPPQDSHTKIFGIF